MKGNALLCSVVTAVATVYGAADPLCMSQVHRGGGRDTRPDNSLETFLWCWEHDVAPEADARLTKDGVAIAFHDGNLKRVGRGISTELAATSVSNLTWAQIREVDVGSYLGREYASTRVPTMESVFAAMSGHPDRFLYLDEKGAPPEMMAEMARRFGVERQVYYTSPNYRLMAKWQKEVPGGLGMVWLGTWPKDNSPEAVKKADVFLEETFAKMERDGWIGISQVQIHVRTDLAKEDPFCPSTVEIRRAIDRLHARGITVQAFTWTEGRNKDVLRRLKSLGFDNFATDDPLVLFELLPEWRNTPRPKGASGARWERSAEGVLLPTYGEDDWQAGWIWIGRGALGERWFRKSFACDPTNLRLAAFQWASDDGAEVFVNGVSLGQVTSWAKPKVNEAILPLLKAGTNEILVRAWNRGSASGFMGELDLVGKDGSIRKIGSGADWEGAERKDGPWAAVREFMRKPQPPYGETPYVDYSGRNPGPVEPTPKAYRPSAGERLVTALRRGNGAMHYFENGVEKPFIAYRTPSTDTRLRPLRYLASMDRAGVRIAELCISLRELWKDDGALDFAALDRKLQVALDYAPHMNFVVFINVDPPPWYVARHREDRFVLDSGIIDRLSYASDAMRRDVCAALAKLVEHAKSGPCYGRIAGFGLDGGYDGQFMQWTDYGYKAMGDYSVPMKRAFGREIPSAERRRGTADRLFLDETADADIIAYNRLFGSVAADFMLACAATIKRATDREKIVGAYYGKFYSLAGYLESGELAIRKVLASSDVDYLIAVEYNQRSSGQPHSISAPTESYALHGKTFMDEADIRTFLDGQKNWGYAGDEKGTESMIRKMFALSFTRGHAIHWYDLFGGWFDHPAIERMIGDVQKVAVRHQSAAVAPAEIAVVCDEESLIHATSAIKRETGRTMNHLQNGVLGRIGAPFDLYFADDLAAAPNYRMYIFLNCFAPTAETRENIARIKASGATCVSVNPGDRVPTPAEYRQMARAAGVHIYSSADDVMVYVGRGLLGVHAGSEGEKTVVWPKTATFRDAISGEMIGRDVTCLTIRMEKGETRLLEVLAP